MDAEILELELSETGERLRELRAKAALQPENWTQFDEAELIELERVSITESSH